ncbi:cupin domain-containing protein [Terriglobus albidus]|uniref:cupin domain-containing protein n=1 Tax=Terriglobus albidus TaxID=1592106 RepID=UPI0021E0097D|nr:cupin domain-containing protein [Terriglobus albidus]
MTDPKSMNDFGTDPAKVISRQSAEHYLWGKQCDGWHLVKQDGLSVIEERMPPATSEVRHHHVRSRQFAYVLEGELTMEVEHHDFTVRAGEGIEIHPGQSHQAMNRSGGDVRFLMISQPPSHGDRIDEV